MKTTIEFGDDYTLAYALAETVIEQATENTRYTIFYKRDNESADERAYKADVAALKWVMAHGYIFVAINIFKI